MVKNVHYGDVLMKFGDYIDASKTELPYISDNAKVEKFKNSFLQDGDIIIADTAEDETVGKCTEIQGSEGVQLLSGLHTIACRPKEKYGPMFLGYYINSPAYHSQLKPLMQGIKVTSISKSAFQDTNMIMPKSIDEQTKIGAYFEEIDHLITLHQRKLFEAKNNPKNGSKNFFRKIYQKLYKFDFNFKTYDWEQRKFEKFAQRQSNTMISNPDNPCIEYEDVISEQGILNKDVCLKDAEKNGIIFTEEDILYGKLRPYLHNWLNPDFKGVAVGDWWVLRPINMDKNFLYWLIQTPQYDNAANQSSGTKMPRADWKLVSNTDFYVPISNEEQAKIAGLFEKINTLITLHQREVFYTIKHIFYRCCDTLLSGGL
ncbi:hypothetical protein [Streptococcus equinus]|uniref:hypothetical protein n=1 Tax=Streptococcus equinus TaxID=1335 RepID=UPI00237A3D91|nr:hypothetical protein [Streptococcus equinus]